MGWKIMMENHEIIQLTKMGFAYLMKIQKGNRRKIRKRNTENQKTKGRARENTHK